MEGGINVEAGLFFKIIKRGGGKTYLINVEGGHLHLNVEGKTL